MLKHLPTFLIPAVMILWAGTLGAEVPMPSQTIEANQTLDKNNAAGTAPDVSTGAFSVALRCRPLGLGADSTGGCGMLFSWGSGWYDGFRAHWSANSNGKICFQIGRGAEGSAVTVTSSKNAPAGGLMEVVCTYDGQTLRIYLNGEAVGEAQCASGITPPKNAKVPLLVGFGGFGIGSLKMEAQKLDYWNVVLTPGQIAEHFADFPELELAKTRLLQSAEFSRTATENEPGAYQNVQKLLQMDGLPEEFREQLRFEQLSLLWFHFEDTRTAAGMLPEFSDLMCEKGIPENETFEAENLRKCRLFTLFTMWERWENLFKKDVEINPEAYKKLQAAFPDDWAEFQKVRDLENQMNARVDKIYDAGIEQWRATAARAEKSADVTLYLAPDGCDENAGTAADAPFQSLSRALEEAGKLQAGGKSVQILTADGEYFCTKTAAFDGTQNVANTDLPTIYVRAADGAKPRFTYALPLRNFQKLDENRDAKVFERFQPEVRKNIRVCDMKRCGVTDFGACATRGYGIGDTMNPWSDVFLGDLALDLARYPNEGADELKIEEIIPVEGGTERDTRADTLRYTDPRIDTWQLPDTAGPNAIFAYGLWQHEWASKTLRVERFDRENRTLTIDYRGIRPKFTYHFLNVLEELDAPGEFYIDRESGMLYVIFPDGTPDQPEDVTFAVSNEMFVKLTGARNVVFDGLSFVGTRTTAAWLQNCENVYFQNCTFGRCGVHGLVVNGGHACGVFNSDLYGLGSCGVRISGGNRDTLEPCFHGVHNCHIHDFCRIDRSYAPAVHSVGVGYFITNNLVHESPHHAFRTEGNDILLARNEVHSVVYDFSDQSGVDIYCDPTYRGIVIRKNFWHHIGSQFALCGQAGIRLDDSISGVLMVENIFYRSAGGVFGAIQIHGGKDNLVRRNLFLCCRSAVSFSEWGDERYHKFVTESFPQKIKPYQEMGVYPFMDEILEHPNRNYILENRAYNCDDFVIRGGRSQIFALNQKSEAHRISPDLDGPSLRVRLGGTGMKTIGIQPCPLFPKGQKGISNAISPHYLAE